MSTYTGGPIQCGDCGRMLDDILDVNIEGTGDAEEGVCQTCGYYRPEIMKTFEEIEETGH